MNKRISLWRAGCAMASSFKRFLLSPVSCTNRGWTANVYAAQVYPVYFYARARRVICVDDSLSFERRETKNGRCIQRYSWNILKILFGYSLPGRKFLKIYAGALATRTCAEQLQKILGEIICILLRRPIVRDYNQASRCSNYRWQRLDSYDIKLLKLLVYSIC